MTNARTVTDRHVLRILLPGILLASIASAFSGPRISSSTVVSDVTRLLSPKIKNDYFNPRLSNGPLQQSSKDGDQEMQSLLNSLKTRQAELEDAEAAKAHQIRFANVESRVAVALDDWVRRIAVDYPLMACGTASGRIYLVNLENGQELGRTEEVAVDDDESAAGLIEPGRLEHVLHQLYGQFDGGGTLAVAVRGDILCAANRAGGIILYRLIRNDDDAIQIIAQGTICRDQLVTTLKLTDDYLIAGTDQGHVLVYEMDELPLKTTPEITWELGRRMVMALDVHEELGLIAVATDSGATELLSMEQVSASLGSFTPPYDGTERRSQNAFPTCVAFVDCSASSRTDEQDKVDGSSVVIACGSNDGSLYVQHLCFEGADVNAEQPFAEERIHSLMPRHFACVKCLASPARDLLVSGGLDGSLRIWDVKERRFLYQFMGYKVWLGSIWTDGLRLCSDGADNTVILHDFTAGTEI